MLCRMITVSIDHHFKLGDFPAGLGSWPCRVRIIATVKIQRNTPYEVIEIYLFRESLNLVSSAFRIAPMPSQVTQGDGVSAALTGKN